MSFCYIPGYAQVNKNDSQSSKEARKKQKEKERLEKEKKEKKEKERKEKEKRAAQAAAFKSKKEKPDTFSIVHQLFAKRKYRKASALLSAYHKNHPDDLNSLWLDAQAQLWLSNFHKSKTLYKTGIQLQPGNDYLKLNYIHSLLDMGRIDTAKSVLENMEKGGSDYPDMSYLRAQMFYWAGDYDQASAYIKKAMELDWQNVAAKDLSDQIIAARAPKISLYTGYLSDNQPYTAVISDLKFEKTFNRFAAIYVEADEYHFIQPGTTDAPWFKAGDKLAFPKIGLQVGIGGGVFKFPVKNEVGWSGTVDLTKKISPSFDFEVLGEEVPYFDTKSSVDTDITATRGSAILYWHKRKWLGQAAAIGNFYARNAEVYSGYAWVMAPIATFNHGQFMLGLSTSYSNSNVNSYTPVNSLSEILANPSQPIAGLYNPYFTPNNLIVNAALASLSLNLSKKVTINLNADIGSGLINNPYFYVDTFKHLIRGTAQESFVPGDFTFVFNYHITKTFLLSAKYIYRSTYFFSSNFAGIGIEKSFWHSKEIVPGKKKKNAFMKEVNDIEQRLQYLYSCKNAEELRSAVSKIRKDMVSLRDAQLKSKNTTEILPDGEASRLLQSRYQNLNDMIHELDAVDLNDNTETSKKDKKQWLVDKLYELNIITYDDTYEDQDE